MVPKRGSSAVGHRAARGLFLLGGVGLVALVEPSNHWEAKEEITAGRLDVAVTETLHLARDAASGETRARFRAIPPRGRRGHAPRIRPVYAGPRDMRGSDIAHPGSPGPGGPGGPGGPAIVQRMVGGGGQRVRRLVVREAQRRVPPRPIPRVRRCGRGCAGVLQL